MEETADHVPRSRAAVAARAGGVFAIAFVASVVAGLLLASIGAPGVVFYAFAVVLTAGAVMQIIAPGAGLGTPAEVDAHDA
jgi:hypothetical protein